MTNAPHDEKLEHPEDPTPEHRAQGTGGDFHPWRLLAAIGVVLVVLAAVAAAVNIFVLGW